ncbi:Uncharacterised protein [Mycobacterium tuberculosis]|nr:Uncharacterised protein [Mycobacterium tuberculosis]
MALLGLALVLVVMIERDLHTSKRFLHFVQLLLVIAHNYCEHTD